MKVEIYQTSRKHQTTLQPLEYQFQIEESLISLEHLPYKTGMEICDKIQLRILKCVFSFLSFSCKPTLFLHELKSEL